MIKLYHGTNIEIKIIDLSKCKPGKDFGQGFYLNPNYEQAYKMARKTTKITGRGKEIVNTFSFDLEKAEKAGLKIKIFPDYCEEWAEFIIKNRKNKTITPIHPYDIVIGPIADNTVGVQIRRFVMGYLPINQLVEELKYHGDHAIQYFFATEEALKFLNYE